MKSPFPADDSSNGVVQEKSHLNAASETETKIRWKKQELKTKKEQLTECMEKHRAEIEDLCGQGHISTSYGHSFLNLDFVNDLQKSKPVI